MLTKKKAGSPCVDVCAIDETTGFCAGCLRTSEEIAMWSRYNFIQRKKVAGQAAIRRQTARANERRSRAHSKDEKAQVGTAEQPAI